MLSFPRDPLTRGSSGLILTQRGQKKQHSGLGSVPESVQQVLGVLRQAVLSPAWMPELLPRPGL